MKKIGEKFAIKTNVLRLKQIIKRFFLQGIMKIAFNFFEKQKIAEKERSESKEKTVQVLLFATRFNKQSAESKEI